jgi:hypothetical protein
VFDLAGPRLAKVVRFRAPERGRTRDVAAAVSPREDAVAFSVDGRVWRYRLATDAVDSPVHVGRVAGLGFTPDGRRLVVVRRGAEPKTLR